MIDMSAVLSVLGGVCRSSFRAQRLICIALDSFWGFWEVGSWYGEGTCLRQLVQRSSLQYLHLTSVREPSRCCWHASSRETPARPRFEGMEETE